jgi:hypothetical protein
MLFIVTSKFSRSAYYVSRYMVKCLYNLKGNVITAILGSPIGISIAGQPR